MDAIVEPRDLLVAIDRAHAVDFDGLCSVAGGPDVACRAIRMSRTSLSVRSNALVKAGDVITLRFPQIGIVEALAVDSHPGGFVLSFEPAPRSKLGTYMAWLDGEAPSADGREHERIVPIKRLTTLKRRGMPASMTRIVDLSRSGAAFTCGKPPEIGEPIQLGATSGSVVRLIDGGAAIRFDALIDEQDFSVLIDLDAVRVENEAR